MHRTCSRDQRSYGSTCPRADLGGEPTDQRCTTFHWADVRLNMPERTKMNAAADKTRNTYIVELRNQHIVENQAIEFGPAGGTGWRISRICVSACSTIFKKAGNRHAVLRTCCQVWD